MTWINLLSFGLYVLSCILTFRRFRKIGGGLLAYLLVFQVWSVASCFYNDLGIYNFELFRYTVPSLATTRLAIFYTIFNLGFWLTGLLLNGRTLANINYRMPKIPTNFNISEIITYGIFIVISCYIARYLSINGIPVLQGMFKVEIAQSFDAFGVFLKGYIFIFVFMLGFFRKLKSRACYADLFIVILVLYYLSIGHKFSALVELLLMYLTPIWVRRAYLLQSAGQINIKTFLLMFIGAVIFLSIAVLHYSSLADVAVFQLLIDRVLAFQGHLWWAVDQDVMQSGLYDHQHWAVELSSLLPGGGDGEVGMRYIMTKVLGSKAHAVFESGYLYTMAYPAILIVSFPYFTAMIIQLMVGGVFFIGLFYLYHAIAYGHIIRSAIAISIIFPLIATMFSGAIGNIFTIGILIKVFVIIALETGFFAEGSFCSYKPEKRAQ